MGGNIMVAIQAINDDFKILHFDLIVLMTKFSLIWLPIFFDAIGALQYS